MKTKIVVIAFALFFFPGGVFAGPIIRSGEDVAIDEQQMLEGDFYGFGSKVSVSGPAKHDAHLVGETVTVNAPVAGDLTIVGAAVQVHGEVGDDLRVIGGEVTIADTVHGDVAVLGGTLTILSTATVEGDVLFFGSVLDVKGNVQGTVHGNSDTARFDGKITGDISYTATESVTLGDGAEVLGGVRYESPVDLIRAQNAQVTGEIQKIKAPEVSSKESLKFFFFLSAVILFASLATFLIGRVYVGRVLDTVRSAPSLAGLVGIGAFLAVPLVSVLLMVSGVGFLFGVFLLMLYVTMLCSTLLLSPVLVGLSLQKIIFHDEQITIFTVIGGVVVLSLFLFVPQIGGFILFAALMILLGALWLMMYHALCSS